MGSVKGIIADRKGKYMHKETTIAQQAEHSLTTTYRRQIWSKFQIAIGKYDLVQDGDKIAVCISGGKDSMLMAKLFQMYQKYHLKNFEIVNLVMDPGYSAANRQKIIDNANALGIDITIFDTNIFAVAEQSDHAPCYLCARMRRGHLYNKAKELGCNKIALGHHLNDAIETTVMSMFYSSKLETIIPKSQSENFSGMELIRPMYCTKEEDILAWVHYHRLEFLQCACKFTEERYFIDENGVGASKRKEVKELLKRLKTFNPSVEDNIFRALHNVQIESFPGFKSDDTLHSFLDYYENGRKIKESKNNS